MSKPTDADLNRAMAEVLGYPGVGYYGPNKPHGMHQDYDRYETVDEAHAAYLRHWERWTEADRETIDLCYWKEDWGPIVVEEYCTDRNALPDILDAVEAAGKQWAMATRLDKDISKGVVESAWIMWRLPMREVVIAALRALGRWPED